MAEVQATEALTSKSTNGMTVDKPYRPVQASQEPQYVSTSKKESHGLGMQILRGVVIGIYFTVCCTTVSLTQFIGAPLYWINREWFYTYMAVTKRYFAIITTTMTSVWGPTTLRISGDESVAGQIRPTPEGGVEFAFPERIILIANHQIYTDWLYLWWIGYANLPRTDGNIYIILKESLKWIPILGWGMQFFGFIFMSRKMETDRPRLVHRLNKLKKKKTGPDGKTYLDPMWLLLFPEGTNLSGNGRKKSKVWADKNGLKDTEHMLLPRSTGSFFILNELKDSVEYVYDCTVAYEGVPRSKYGEDLFTLSSTYFQGHSPNSVNFYWRRFRVADIPLDNADKFDVWLRDEWYKKDALAEQYLTTGRFPPMAGGKIDYVTTGVKTKRPWEILQIFSVVGICGLIWNNVVKIMNILLRALGLKQ